MIDCEWIVCERSNRWAAALRMAIGRDAAAGGPRRRLREVRRLAELTAELAQRPASFVAIEIHRNNLGEALEWLAAARQYPLTRCVALVDRSLPSTVASLAPSGPATEREIRAALREAGALDVAESSRGLHAVLELGRRHAAVVSAAQQAVPGNDLPLEDRVWAALPWQPD